ncbi:unnamed protein product [Aphanomyces euteiches]
MADDAMLSDYGFPKWVCVYAVVLGISLLASSVASWTLYKYTKVVTSCVCYAMLSFFVWKSIYSLFRVIVLVFAMRQYQLRHSNWLTLDENHDVGGFRVIGYPDPLHPGQKQPPYYVKVPLYIGDTTMLSGAFWMLVLVIELLRLARRTVDRGSKAEKKFLRMYICINFAILVVYLLGSFSSSILSEDTNGSQFYASRFQMVLIASCTAQTIVIFLVSAAVIYLNCAGLKFESVECRVVQKPLYVRLKRIFLIYLVTALPYLAVGWVLAVNPKTVLLWVKDIPNEILVLSNVLYVTSPCAFAFVLVANQKCMLSLCMVSDDVVLLEIEANEAPREFPVFVNTDIESSSALWSCLGNVMHDAQDLHDNLLRRLLVPHHGYEITTAGDSFQLAFHNIADAVAYCLDVQEQLLLEPWPTEFVESSMPGSATILAPKSNVLKRTKTLFHGVRVRMGIHASDAAEGDLVSSVHPITGRVTYVGLSELIGREVSDLGHGGQIIVTAPVLRWLRQNMESNSTWAIEHPCVFHELGVYHISDLKIDLGIAHIVPMSLKERADIFGPIDSIQRTVGYTGRLSNNYELLFSPKVSHFV